MSDRTAPPRDTANVVTLPPLLYLGPLTLGLVLNAIQPRPLLLGAVAIMRCGVIDREEHYLEECFGVSSTGPTRHACVAGSSAQ